MSSAVVVIGALRAEIYFTRITAPYYQNFLAEITKHNILFDYKMGVYSSIRTANISISFV